MLEENTKPGYWLLVSNWWGLSKTPGCRGIFLYPDGSYVHKLVVFCTKKQPNGYTKEVQGKLLENQLATVKKYVDENITSSKTQQMFDAGCSIKFYKENQTIEIDNLWEVYKEVNDLLPVQQVVIEEEYYSPKNNA